MKAGSSPDHVADAQLHDATQMLADAVCAQRSVPHLTPPSKAGGEAPSAPVSSRPGIDTAAVLVPAGNPPAVRNAAGGKAGRLRRAIP
jgi:hypothetical protein